MSPEDLDTAPPKPRSAVLSAATVGRFLIGKADAVRTVAGTRSAFPLGALLVLLTTIPRNYDQTHITESPARWLLGNLGFSLVSGTWLYAVAYGLFARRSGPASEPRPRFWSAWIPFMGLFWMTAPVAWLYALPVERFFDSVTAARCNVGLLLVVSVWRVALMTRVFQVLGSVAWYRAVLWVLIPAAGEVLAVAVFGDSFARAIMAGMGGLRNSPEQEVLIGAMGVASAGAFYGLPVLLLTTALMPRPDNAHPWNHGCLPGRMPLTGLGIVAALGIGIAIPAQMELSRSLKLERWTTAGQARQALDWMAAVGPGGFAPSRPMSPKPFESESLCQLAELARATTPEDPDWIIDHLNRRTLDVFRAIQGFPRPSEPQYLSKSAPVEISQRLAWADPDGECSMTLVDKWILLPRAHAWLQTNLLVRIAWIRAADQLAANPGNLGAWPRVGRTLRAAFPEPTSNASEPANP
jgi:hypothetical protein